MGEKIRYEKTLENFMTHFQDRHMRTVISNLAPHLLDFDEEQMMSFLSSKQDDIKALKSALLNAYVMEAFGKEFVTENDIISLRLAFYDAAVRPSDEEIMAQKENQMDSFEDLLAHNASLDLKGCGPSRVVLRESLPEDVSAHDFQNLGDFWEVFVNHQESLAKESHQTFNRQDEMEIYNLLPISLVMRLDGALTYVSIHTMASYMTGLLHSWSGDYAEGFAPANFSFGSLFPNMGPKRAPLITDQLREDLDDFRDDYSKTAYPEMAKRFRKFGDGTLSFIKDREESDDGFRVGVHGKTLDVILPHEQEMNRLSLYHFERDVFGYENNINSVLEVFEVEKAKMKEGMDKIIAAHQHQGAS